MRCLGGPVKPASLLFPHSSGVFSNIHFISHHSLIYFLQKMNSSPLTVNTRITKITNTEINYWVRLRKSKRSTVSPLLRPSSRLLSATACWNDQAGTDWSDTVLYRRLLFGVCGHGPSYYWLKTAACVSSSSPLWTEPRSTFRGKKSIIYVWEAKAAVFGFNRSDSKGWA